MSRKTRQRRRGKPAPGPGLAGRMVRGVLRLVWAVAWRIGAIAAVITGTATLYFYSHLPPSDRLFDGRGVGSVTLRDVNG